MVSVCNCLPWSFYLSLLSPRLTPNPLAATCGGPDICCSECGRRVEGARRKNGEIIPRDAPFVDSMENGESGPSADLAKVAG